MGKGWYPDALIPFEHIQEDSSQINRRWIYPFWLPDFNNRIPNQKSVIIWVDQYIPFEYKDAPPGTYTSSVSVSVSDNPKEMITSVMTAVGEVSSIAYADQFLRLFDEMDFPFG